MLQKGFIPRTFSPKLSKANLLLLKFTKANSPLEIFEKILKENFLQKVFLKPPEATFSFQVTRDCFLYFKQCSGAAEGGGDIEAARRAIRALPRPLVVVAERVHRGFQLPQQPQHLAVA